MCTNTDVLDIVPGDEYTLSATLPVLSGDSYVTAILRVVSRHQHPVIPPISGNVTGQAVAFPMQENQTIALSPWEPYYLYSVVGHTTNGHTVTAVAEGRILFGSAPPMDLPIVKLGWVSETIQVASGVHARKTP